ncbi:MAG: ATP synthase F1 subunit epsilon [Ruminococcaceae bacterium]|nr:ATP synthase F1 subunit epsilon [Oscillospiraceae bacterium]
MAAVFHLRIRSADRDFFEGECVSLTMALSDGELGLLANHTPLVAAVTPGVLSCRLPDGGTLTAANGNGIVRFENNDALLLLDSVERAEEIDAERAERARQKAEEDVKSAKTPQELLQARSDLRRAQNRLRAAERKP